MMYYYWSRKGIRPSVFHNMSPGELTVVQAFYEKEIEEKNKLANSGQPCPLGWW